jgi:hypothetical protein
LLRVGAPPPFHWICYYKLALLHGRWGCYAPEKAMLQIAAVLT